MNISEDDKKILESIGVLVDGETVRIEDKRNKVTHEFKLEELAQLFLKRSFKIRKQIKASRMYALVVCGWDCSRTTFTLENFDQPKVKGVLKRLNMFFYCGEA